MAALPEGAPQGQPQHGAALPAANCLPAARAKLSREPSGSTSPPRLSSREISAEGGGRGGRRRKEEPPPPLPPRAGAGDGVGRGSRALTPRSGTCGVSPFPQPPARAWPLPVSPHLRARQASAPGGVPRPRFLATPRSPFLAEELPWPPLPPLPEERENSRGFCSLP